MESHHAYCGESPCVCAFIQSRLLDARVYVWLMIVGVLTSIVQLLCTDASKSFALFSDTLHVVLDVGIFALGFLLARWEIRAGRELNQRRYVTEILQITFLVATAIYIFVEASERLSGAIAHIALRWMLWGGIAGFLGNAVQIGISWRVKRARIVQFHNATDLLCSAVAILSAVLMLYGVESTADSIASIMIGLVIMLGALMLLFETLGLRKKHTH